MNSNGHAYEKVINHIEKQIIERKLKTGDRLPPERELAQQLGASRNSVREGLCILERMGVISSQQGAGNFITDRFEKTLIELLSMMFVLDCSSFREITEFRYALEMQAISLAIDHAGETDIEKMETYVRLLDSDPSEDMRAYYDKCIHYTIAEVSGNRFIIDNLQALTEVMDQLIKDMRKKILSDDSNKDGLMDTHRSLVEAIRMRDKKKARQALELHFNYIYNYLDC